MYYFLVAAVMGGVSIWLALFILEWMPEWLLFLFIGAILVLGANKK
jgi:hypothetical protein